jgi:glycosyltransferase involved in cell wall biosynthesis
VKIAFVSCLFPPTWSGQAMMIERLLRGFEASTYVLLRTMPMTEDDGYTDPLPGKTFDLPGALPPLPSPRPSNVVRLTRTLVNSVRHRAAAIADIVRREDCYSIVAGTGGDMIDIPAAHLAARKVGVPFFPYFFDHWSQQAVFAPRLRRLAELVEPHILRQASTVIVPNEFLARDLERRVRVRTVIVRNGCELPSAHSTESAQRKNGATAAIVYTGAVYAANHDAFRNLANVLDSTGLRATLHLYTAQPEEEVAQAGIRGPVSVHAHRPLAEIPALQAEADILFLPLAFDTPYPALIRSSSPAKMAEYLAAGRPILVHAPPDSFVSWYFSKHACGVVVDKLEPEPLAAAVRRLLEDGDLRRRLGAAAQARAVADFDISAARETFAATVGITAPKLRRRRL